MLAKLSIRAKITIVVSFLLFAMTGLGLFALLEMRTINASAEEIQTNWLPSVRVLGDLRADVGSYRNIVRLHVMSETAEAMTAAEGRLAAVEKKIAQSRQVYEKLIISPEERALYMDWVRQWGLFTAGTSDVMAMSRKSIGRSSQEAQEMNEKTVIPLGLKADELLIKDIELNRKGSEEAGAAAAASYDTALTLTMIIIGMTATVGIVVGYILVRDVSRGIASIVAPMQLLGKGDLTAVVPHQGEKTEIGAMADTLQVFKQALIDKRATDAVATEDAEEKIRHGERVSKITLDFESMIGEVVEMVSSASTELEASAGTLTATANRSQQLATVVASAANEASSNVQSVASATEELTSSVNEISRQVQQSANIAGEAVEQARATNERVGELAKAAARIGDVVELINTIAGQTNLLALNATIEAARAGDAGRGFAVVASEVKALAEQTARATGEISQQISGIQTATQESVSAIKQIGDTIGRMSEISSTIASAVEEQGAATQEISRNVQQAAHGTTQVSSNIADVEQGATETGSASSQVLSAAQSLSSESIRLKFEVGRFLTAVRAA